LTALLAPASVLPLVVSLVSLLCLAGWERWLPGGRASATVGAGRVAFWGALAMGVTAAVGRLFGAVV